MQRLCVEAPYTRATKNLQIRTRHGRCWRGDCFVRKMDNSSEKSWRKWSCTYSGAILDNISAPSYKKIKWIFFYNPGSSLRQKKYIPLFTCFIVMLNRMFNSPQTISIAAFCSGNKKKKKNFGAATGCNYLQKLAKCCNKGALSRYFCVTLTS